MIYKLLGRNSARFIKRDNRIRDTVALMSGAHILQVHDVREAVKTVQITEKLKIESGYDK